MDRIQLRLALACAALLGLAACGDDDGGDRGGGIMFMDSGVPDAGGGGGGGATDAGSGGGGGGVCGAITANGQQMPAECMPRCEFSTLEAWLDCQQNSTTSEELASCTATAFAADRYPTARIMLGPTVEEANCELCFDVQFEACIASVCPTQYQSFLTCVNSAGSNWETACASQLDAVYTCVNEDEVEASGTCLFGTEANPLAGTIVQCVDIATATSQPLPVRGLLRPGQLGRVLRAR